MKELTDDQWLTLWAMLKLRVEELEKLDFTPAPGDKLYNLYLIKCEERLAEARELLTAIEAIRHAQ